MPRAPHGRGERRGAGLLRLRCLVGGLGRHARGVYRRRVLVTRAGGPGNRRTWALWFLRTLHEREARIKNLTRKTLTQTWLPLPGFSVFRRRLRGIVMSADCTRPITACTHDHQ